MLRLLFAGTLLVIGLGCQTEGSQTPAEGEIPKVGAEPSASTPVSKETPPSSPGIKEAPVKQPAQKGETSLVVYSGRGAVLVESLFAAFTEQTGIRVDVRYGKTGALAQQLAKEGLNSPADLFFAQDSGYLGALDQAGLFDDILKPDQEKVAPRYLPKQSNWLPTSGRARVLVYSPERIKPEQLPKRLEDLPTTTLSGRFGWAPTNASLHAHVSALRSLWGEAKTESWLNGMKALKPVKFPKNSPQVRGVSAGEIDVGWVNHYYLHKLRAADPSLKAANYSFAKGDAGNLMMLSGVAVLKSSKSKAAAAKLVSFLLSDEGQNHFAQKVFEYPVRDGVKRHPDVPAIGEDMIRVEQTKLTDVSGTLALLRRLDIN